MGIYEKNNGADRLQSNRAADLNLMDGTIYFLNHSYLAFSVAVQLVRNLTKNPKDRLSHDPALVSVEQYFD